MKRALLALMCAFLSVCTVWAFEDDVCCKVVEKLEFQPGNPYSSKEVTFPAVPKKAGKVAVMKINQRILFKTYGGWSRQGCALEINGKKVDSLYEGNSRLLYRGDVLHTKGPKDKEVVYFYPCGGREALLSMYAPADTENMMSTVLDAKYGYDYYLVVEDLVKSNGQNKVVFYNMTSKKIANYPMYIKAASIVYVDADKLEVSPYPGDKVAVKEGPSVEVFHKIVSNLEIQPGAGTVSKDLTFPAVPKKAGKLVVLKLNQRIASKVFAGWTRQGCSFDINGKKLTPMYKGNCRLLYRGTIMHTNSAKPKDRAVSYFDSVNGRTTINTLYAPAKAKNLPPNVIDKKFGYDYYIVIDDMVNDKATNTLRIYDMMPAKIVKYPLFIKEATIVYVNEKDLTPAVDNNAAVINGATGKTIKATAIANGAKESGSVPFVLLSSW